MKNNEEKISEYIDALNEEKKPREHEEDMDSVVYEDLMETVRKVKSLKEVRYPEDNFERKLIKKVRRSKKQNSEHSKRKWIYVYAAVAVIMIGVIIAASLLPINTSIVSAMEESYQQIKAYHGMLETMTVNEKGEETLLTKWEVWADTEGRYAINVVDGYQKGSIIVNNGDKKWQVKPDARQIIQYAAFPDTHRFTLELGNEVENVKNALKVKKAGEENISDKPATKLEITPDGGNTYYIWIDNETNLPIQRQSAMVNAVRYRVTYTDLDLIDSIPDELMQYANPDGYAVIDKNNEQIVGNIEEAGDIAGFIPKTFNDIPDGFVFDGMTVERSSKNIRLYYKTSDNQKSVIVSQEKTSQEFKRDSAAVLGKVNNNYAEYLPSSDNVNLIRWQEEDIIYTITGDTDFEELAGFAEKLSGGKAEFNLGGEEMIDKPEVNVQVDMAVEENNQKSVDAGNSPWLLDPAYVAQVWASLQIYPEGITGEYPIAYEDVHMAYNDGVNAVAEISTDTATVKKVYLKRLIRQDSTGIWTVVGRSKS